MYIVFEGIVGTGKSTQSKLLAEKLQQLFPDRLIILTKEPGGSEVANEIRRVVQGTKFAEEMDPHSEAYLYAASRAHTLRTIVRPCLDKRGIVISDRSFISSVAFQGYGRGLGINTIIEINRTAIQDHLPDLVIFLDGNTKKLVQRSFDKSGDKFEELPVEFFKKVKKGYAEVMKNKELVKKHVKINAEDTIENIHEQVLKEVLAEIKS